MAKRSYALWEELQESTQTELIVETGGADYAPRNHANMKLMLDVCERNHVDFELLDHLEVAERYPGLSLPEDYSLVATKKAGNVNWREEEIRSW